VPGCPEGTPLAASAREMQPASVGSLQAVHEQMFLCAMSVMSAIAIVLHGPTSAGKSSIASSLQDSALVPAFHVTLDAFVTMSRRRDMRSPEEQHAAYRLQCENLRAPLSTLEQRGRERGDRGVGMAREQHNHPAFSRIYDLVIDTSSCTPDEGVAALRDFIGSRSR